MFDAVRILMWVLESGRIPNHGSIKYNQIGFLATSNASVVLFQPDIYHLNA
jgi:hypothetical protein